MTVQQPPIMMDGSKMEDYKRPRSLLLVAMALLASVVLVLGAGSRTLPIISEVTARQLQNTLVAGTFTYDNEGFTFASDEFRSTSNPTQARGRRTRSKSIASRSLKIILGGRASLTSGQSGGWSRTFTIDAPTPIQLKFRYRVVQQGFDRAWTQIMARINGRVVGQAPFDYVTQILGKSNTRTSSGGWKDFEVHLGTLPAGSHTLTLGAFNSGRASVTDWANILIDNVQLVEMDPPPTDGPQKAVDQLSTASFKSNIEMLSSFGDRTQGSSSYNKAAGWVEDELSRLGYKVERHAYSYYGSSRETLYVTKVGAKFPDRMFIISAHLDGRGGGGAANDDGSGCSLVLEIARVLSLPGISTDISVRMVFWNNEETGLNGASAYVRDRAKLQGWEQPKGSGLYPEPTWLGMITHDQILFDHGTPAGPDQSPNADADIEFQRSALMFNQANVLADALHSGNQVFAKDYPAQVSNNMCCTDSVPFQDYTAAVSVRENQRLAEIGQGAAPHWHQKTDVYSTYSDADFLFGFNIVQNTLGSVGRFVGLTAT